MKTGLLVPFRGDGPILQAAALAQTVSSLAGDCELINYPPEPELKKASKADRVRRERFQRFLRARLPLSGHRFESLEELRSAELPYDLLLCAGKQPKGPLDPVLLGRFTQRRRAAYGLHFDSAAFFQDCRPAPEVQLAELSHLSVQTEGMKTLLQSKTGQDPAVVLDPILLLTADQWSAMASEPPVQPPYILWNCNGNPGPLGPYLRRLALETGLPVVRLGTGEPPRRLKIRTLRDAGPGETVSLYQNAAYILTDSFWGTALAIVFQRPFFTAPASERDGSRRAEVLNRLGLTARIAGRGDAAAPMDPIDWTAPAERLASCRLSSLDYLRAALLNQTPPRQEPEDRPVQLADRAVCTGCTACAAVCPQDAVSMARDKEGFDYPVIDRSRCTSCGLCVLRCPAGIPRETRHLPAAFAAWNQDDAVRRDSASGGVFSALADFVLEGGGVVFGAAMDGQQRLRHAACFSKEGLWRLRGAKYVQSCLGDTFRMVRECLETRQVLFTGTPCQVDGLYRFLGDRPEGLITCDLVCQGVPSPGVWESFVHSIEQRKRKGLQAVRFCNKVTGWADSHFTVVYDNGTVDSAPLRRTNYGQAFLRGLTLRPACYACPYASMARPGDFTLGDFRGLRPDELPEQQQRGVSLLLVNTPHGSHIFDQLPLRRQAFPAERAIAANPALAAPAMQPPDRGAFFAAYALEPFETVRRRYLAQPPLTARLLTRKKAKKR